METSPPSGSTNFEESEVRFLFDEFIQVTNPSDITMSPPGSDEPEVKVRGKHLTIELPDSLAEETTYSIDFGNAVADLNESNVLRNFVYAFSTGAELDSLKLSGEVSDAISGKGQGDVLVMLYAEATPDSSIFRARPRYRTRNDDEGRFQFQFLKQGRYQIVALRDANLNLLKDPEERIAFSDSVVIVDTSSESISMRLFQESGKVRMVSATMSKHGRVTVVLNRAEPRASFRLTDAAVLCLQRSITQDTLFGWVGNSSDSATVILTLDGAVVDSANVTANRSSKVELSAVWEGDRITVTTSAPVSQLIDSVRVMFDSVTHFIKLMPDPGSCQTSFIGSLPGVEADQITLEVDAGTFTTSEGDSSRTASLDLVHKKAPETGQVTIIHNLTSSSIQHVIQILAMTKEANIFRSFLVRPGEPPSFSIDLPVGNYRIRLIKDANSNGVWDSGEYPLRQPEDVINYSQVIEVKSGWDQEVELDKSKSKKGVN